VRIVISAFGGRGDIQRYLALAAGMQRAGHRVTLATSAGYREWI
jgi:UDP:flavonoid glycosyltransferase YjiC (YdhE family)